MTSSTNEVFRIGNIWQHRRALDVLATTAAVGAASRQLALMMIATAAGSLSPLNALINFDLEKLKLPLVSINFPHELDADVLDLPAYGSPPYRCIIIGVEMKNESESTFAYSHRLFLFFLTMTTPVFCGFSPIGEIVSQIIYYAFFRPDCAA